MHGYLTDMLFPEVLLLIPTFTRYCASVLSFDFHLVVLVLPALRVLYSHTGSYLRFRIVLFRFTRFRFDDSTLRHPKALTVNGLTPRQLDA
jgi:hypothetical protein